MAARSCLRPVEFAALSALEPTAEHSFAGRFVRLWAAGQQFWGPWDLVNPVMAMPLLEADGQEPEELHLLRWGALFPFPGPLQAVVCQ